MSESLKNYGAHGFGELPPDLVLQHRAIDAAKAHPNYCEASAHVYCEPSVFFFQGERLLAVKRRLPQIPAELERVVVVSFMTSTCIPKPLWGAGKTYDFILHPDSMQIFDATIGTWKS
jgi:hypothetical protein